MALSLFPLMYHIVYGVLYLISLLPLKVLFLLSDFAYFIIYLCFRYRKKVVMQNLTIAFSEKTEEEKEAIARNFYKNFCDTFIETIKFISADEKFFRKHFVADYSIVEELYKAGKSVQLHMGHNFNWELANLSFPFYIHHKTLVLYSPLQNKVFDRLLLKIRTRTDTKLIAANNMRVEMLPHRNSQYIIALIADQSPPDPDKSYWVDFFGRSTGFFKGPEKMARLNDFPVVFCHFKKSKRGYYIGHAELATHTPRALEEGQLTKMYAQMIERLMTENPEMWLWSHRRWKREWKQEYGRVIN
jgi:KDO2-lipid IV(A) lauroyltransferase